MKGGGRLSDGRHTRPPTDPSSALSRLERSAPAAPDTDRPGHVPAGIPAGRVDTPGGICYSGVRRPPDLRSGSRSPPCGCPSEGRRTPDHRLPRKGETSCAVPPPAVPAARPATPDAVNTSSRCWAVSRSNSDAAAHPTPAPPAADRCFHDCSDADCAPAPRSGIDASGLSSASPDPSGKTLERGRRNTVLPPRLTMR